MYLPIRHFCSLTKSASLPSIHSLPFFSKGKGKSYSKVPRVGKVPDFELLKTGAGWAADNGRENGNVMRLDRKVTFVPCTVGMYLPDGFDSWEDVYGKGIPYIYIHMYIYVYDERTDRDNANERNMSKRWFFLRIDT